jgi:L-alanine-DL-glutamate epimerase-like enolase superfamily enzyme
VISLEAVDLKLRHAFKTSRSRTDVSRSYYFKSDGGVGEGSPVRFYGETAGTMEAAFDFVAKHLPDWDDPRQVWPITNRLLGYNFALKCGLDLLYWDHWGKRQNASIGQLLDIDHSATTCTAFSIGIDAPEEMQAEVKRRPEFKVFKLKVGFEGDVDAVAAVRQVTDVPLYVDANGGWSVEEACRKLPMLQKLGVVLCEQPIFSGARKDWERVREAAAMPVIVDEYLQRPDDVEHWKGWADGINVKLQKCGGITPAYDTIRRARDEGMRVMLGCMIESSVSIAAAAHLAPLVDYVDLDSHLYLDFDPYAGVQCDNGCLRLSGKPGLGVSVRERTSV